MTLQSGVRLGPYEIVATLGAGGMGEVYRAKDTRLGREVAIKVLPAEVAGDAERLRRFELEAKAVSALNHPHIVTLFEVGSSEHGPYLVLEKIEGQSLRELLRAGALSAKRVLTIGAQIAEGLAKAHAAGIVHRDLKPENVMVTSDGFAKILDFGLAKLVFPELEGGAPHEMTTLVDRTASGMILGTLGYLSPEQAAGRPADFRSDQFALGALLYELATGVRPFQRQTTPESLAAVIREEPEPIRSKNAALPAQLGWIVERCLQKLPDDRYGSTRDLARDLADLRDHLSEVAAPTESTVSHPRRSRLAVVIAYAALVGAAAVTIALLTRSRVTSTGSPVVRAAIVLPAELEVGDVALSPDGERLAFTASERGAPDRLYVQRLDDSQPQALPGTDDASLPFWSPERRRIGFFAAGKLKKVDAAGGPAVAIADVERGMGGSWGADETIVFAPASSAGLVRISAAGGATSPVTRLDEARGETFHRYPHFLPDGRHFLYLASGIAGGAVSVASSLRVAAVDGSSDEPILDAKSNAVYAAGHLLYVRGEVLVAQPFDPEARRVSGAPVPIADRFTPGDRKFLHVVSAAERVLVHRPVAELPSRLLWYDRAGRLVGSLGGEAYYLNTRISPDGSQVVADRFDPARGLVELRLFDIASGAERRLAFPGWNVGRPAWSPDGDRIALLTDEGSVLLHARIGIQPLDGSAQQPFAPSTDDRLPEDWSLDGRAISFVVFPARGPRDPQIWAAYLPDGSETVPVATAGASANSRFSPDGRWIAYESNESGRLEVYVRPFPGPGRTWQISVGGGRSPAWRRDGLELYLLNQENVLQAVRVRIGETFEAGTPTPLFTVYSSRFFYGLRSPAFDVTADGERFLVNGFATSPGSPPLQLVVNWPSLVERHTAAPR
jgi:eukaryotic-like serine/threonine-protein kinase